MSAVITPPTAADTRSALADWIELQALGSTRGRSIKATLSNVFDISEDNALGSQVLDEETGEILDEAILEEGRSAIMAATLEELEYRRCVLGTTYPFAIDGTRLVLGGIEGASIMKPGQLVYLFCLLASAIRERKLHPVERLGTVESEIANIFQICACLAAGGYVSGQVDVIAWRDHPDGMPGKIYLLGQCASGKNWKAKSIVEYVEQLHGAWFTRRPATWSLPAMFIPFTLHHDLTEDRRGPFLDALKNRYWHEEMRFGIIFDRLRISHFAQGCLDAESRSCRVDGADRLENVQSWVANALRLAGIRKAA